MKSFYLAIWCNARIIWVYPSLIEEANFIYLSIIIQVIVLIDFYIK